MRSPQGEEEEGEGGIADTVLCSYISAVGDGEGDALNKGGDLAVGLERVREALLGNGGGGVCVICLENMSPHDSVWSCGGDDGDDEIEAATIDADVQSGCYYVMHLQCIQSWQGGATNKTSCQQHTYLSTLTFDNPAPYTCTSESVSQEP